MTPPCVIFLSELILQSARTSGVGLGGTFLLLDAEPAIQEEQTVTAYLDLVETPQALRDVRG